MRRKSEAGQALWVTAAGLTALMGFAGLAIDMGVLRYEKRLQQAAADAAAIAGADNLTFGGVQAGALDAAARNLFADNTGGGACGAPPTNLAGGSVTVTVCNGPSTGPHAGNANYVEAYVSAGHPTYFMKVVGINVVTITARAVATNVGAGGGSGGGCLYTLGPPSSSIEGVNINGNATLNATTCGIEDNGNFNTKGNALTVNAGTFGMSGDWNRSGPGGTVTCADSALSCPTPNMPAAADPLSYLTPPCSPCTGGNPLNASGTVSPGTYSSITIGPTTVNFSPGLYIINGPAGLYIGANATVTGTGVTFYFTNGATVTMRGTPTVQLTAPSSGQYPGVLFYQDPQDTSGPSIGGNASSFYDGALYFPKAAVTFFGNSSIGDVAIVVTDAINLSGHPTVNLQGTAGLPPGVNLIKDAILVE